MSKNLMVFILVLCVAGTALVGWRVESAGAAQQLPVSKQESDLGGVCC